jgi:GDP-L-fucose synthase
MLKEATTKYALKGKRVYIAGIHGMVGSAIARRLSALGDVEVLGDSSQELDLRIRSDVKKRLSDLNPDILVIAAARVGGIKANNDYPVEFLNENLEIQLNLMSTAHKLGVSRLLFLGSSCIYPKFADQPIDEGSLLTGSLEPSNKAYALAKIVGIEQVSAYRREYGMDWISAMPCNLYGPGDYFNDKTSHVIPGLMQRFLAAKTQGLEEVTAWGSGNPLREFLHVDDLSDALVFLLENYNEMGHINIGAGSEITIKDLTSMIAKIVGFTGTITWDVEKPDGTPRKILNSDLINSFGWRAQIELETGLRETFEWMQLNLSKLRN